MRPKQLIFLLICLLFLSCKNSSVDKSLQQKMIALIINEIAIPLPPPPPPAEESFNNQTLSKEKIDSIKAIRLNIGLDPLQINYNQPISIKNNYPSDFINLIKEIPFQDTQAVLLNNIQEVSKHNVEFVTWDANSKMNNFNVFIKISKIILSEDKSKAAAIAIRKMGEFDGTTFLFLFKINQQTDEIKIYRKYVLLMT